MYPRSPEISEAKPYVRPMIYNPRGKWEPSDAVIRSLQRKAKARGFYFDWQMIGVMSNGDMLLMRDLGNDNQGHLIAEKHGGKWELKFECDVIEF